MFILSLEVVKVVVVILVESVCFDVVGVELVWFFEEYVWVIVEWDFCIGWCFWE